MPHWHPTAPTKAGQHQPAPQETRLLASRAERSTLPPYSSHCPTCSRQTPARSPTPLWAAGAATSRRPGDSRGFQSSFHRDPEALSHPPQPQVYGVGPFPPLQKDRYWVYVTTAREDTGPKEFQDFLHVLGPPRSSGSTRVPVTHPRGAPMHPPGVQEQDELQMKSERWGTFPNRVHQRRHPQAQCPQGVSGFPP